MTTIALSDATKRLLDEVRPRGVSNDGLVQQILATRPIEEWKEVLGNKMRYRIGIALARRARMMGAPGATRDPSEQVLLAKAAEARWNMWLETGKVKVIGERSFVYRPGAPEYKPPTIEVVRPDQGGH